MSELVLYNRHLAELRTAVERLDTVDEAKDVADRAAAAQTWARRVRLGQDALNHAAEVKLRAERRAGELLVGMPKHPPGRYPSSPARDIPPRLADLGVSYDQSSEWQALAAIPQRDFDEAVESAKADGEVTRNGVLRRSMDVHYSSATPQWSTPQALFDLLDSEFQFDLDVCASDENAKCATWFTEREDGLSQPWTGTCWMNPPYGDEIVKWVRKAWESAQNGATVVCLVPARVDTGWWWDYCRFGEVRFLRGRLRFGGGDTGAPFPSAVVVFGREQGVEWWERWRAA